MADRYQYPQKNFIGVVSNEDASLCPISAVGEGVYLYIEKLNISISKAAVGGDGILQIKDTNGLVKWEMNVDGVKDFNLNFGDEGVLIGEDVGLLATVSGAGTTQASVSVGGKGHVSMREK